MYEHKNYFENHPVCRKSEIDWECRTMETAQQTFDRLSKEQSAAGFAAIQAAPKGIVFQMPKHGRDGLVYFNALNTVERRVQLAKMDKSSPFAPNAEACATTAEVTAYETYYAAMKACNRFFKEHSSEINLRK